MSVKAESWQKAEIAGPKKALLILKPEVVAALLRRAKRPILVVGHLAAESQSDAETVDYAIRLSEAADAPVVATANTIKKFVQKHFTTATQMPAMDIGNRLADPEWKGLDGKGAYDLVIFMGLPYYMEFVILAGLKHFSKNQKTISLDRYYNPHATWSFPNLSVKDWKESLQVILNKLGEK